MGLVDMKLTKKESTEEDSPVISGKTTGPQYPWGLSLDLDNNALEKLGISIEDFSVGDDIEIRAVGKIKRLSSAQYEGEDKDDRMDIQITKMGISSSSTFDKEFDKAAKKKGG